MPHLAAALLTALALLAVPASAVGQAGVSYQVPGDNPFAAQPGAAPEVYALGLRNPYRFSFDRLTGDLLIGDVGGGQREEIDWVTAAGARGANFGWSCREGKVENPASDECPVPGAVEPLFEYLTTDPGADAVTGGFVVRDPTLDSLVGRYLYADYFEGEIHSLALNFAAPDNQTTGLTVANLASFGEDASGRLYVVSFSGGTVVRLVTDGPPGTLAPDPLTGPFSQPVAIGTYPGDATRLFVAQVGGKVRLVDDDAVLTTPYLDVAPFGLSTGGERGLLSVAAAPDYATSGKVYVYYTDGDGDIRIDEFTRSATVSDTADPASRRPILEIEHSNEENHNGGQLHFGPDGCLWVTTGDGGGQNNQHDNSQNLGTLLGKVLRIDPDPPGVGGTRCGGAAPPPSNPIATPDTTAPGLAVNVRRRQRVLRLRGAIAYARCSEACRVSMGGTLRVGRRNLLLRRATRSATPNQRVRLRARLRPRARRVLRRALANGRHARVTLRLRATDAGGNRSQLVRRSVRVRR